MNELAIIEVLHSPALVAAAGSNARTRFAEFFVNNIRNVHKRRAYARNVQEFLAWCEDYGVASIADVQPLHVGTYIELLTRDPHLSAPTIKQKLAAIRMLFDRLVTGQVMGVNPAASVRVPSQTRQDAGV